MANLLNIPTKVGKQRGILSIYLLHSIKNNPKSGYELLSEIKGKTDGSIEKTITTSEPTTVTLNAPTDITDSSMVLSWTENSDSNFARYELYYSQSSGVSQFDTLAASIADQATTEFTVEGLSSGTTYYYRVYVINDIEQAAPSNQVGGTTN